MRGFYSKHRWLLVHIEQSFHHEVLSLVDEALAELFALDESGGRLLQHLDVFAGGQLSLLLDSLLSDILSNLMRVNVRVIFTNFAQESLRILLSLSQKYFLCLKDFSFDIVWRVDIELTW